MGRKQKHPNHTAEAEKLMNTLLDELAALWTAADDPKLKEIAEAVDMSVAKVRKLLITAGVRDKRTYYSSPTADHVLRLWKEGKKTDEIQTLTGLSASSISGYLPHTKIIYSLESMSAEAERIKVFRSRQKVVEELQNATLDWQVKLWRCVVAFEGFQFKTSGRGSRPGIAFSYTVSRADGAGGRHYEGVNVDSYGNELWITSNGKQLEKSISRSTVELAFKRAAEAGGRIGGPKALGIPGAGSYLYPMLVRFGVIMKNEP